MNIQKYTLYTILVFTIILIIILVILGIINLLNEHEFISDLTGLKFYENNEFTNEICWLSNNKCLSQKPNPVCNDYIKNASTPQDKYIEGYNTVLGSILVIISNALDVRVPELSCTNDQLNNINKYFTFSKTQAEQILSNNRLLIDKIYGNKRSKNYIKDLFNLIKALLVSYKGSGPFKNAIGSRLKKIHSDYKYLSNDDQKNIDIVVSEIFITELVNIINPISLIPSQYPSPSPK